MTEIKNSVGFGREACVYFVYLSIPKGTMCFIYVNIYKNITSFAFTWHLYGNFFLFKIVLYRIYWLWQGVQRRMLLVVNFCNIPNNDAM